MEQFSDGQIWESEIYVVKIEQMENDLQALFFRKENLKFVTIEVRKEKIGKFLKNLGAKLTNKKLVLKEKS